MYDVRGLDGTGTSANPVTSGANAKTYTVRKLADGNCWMTENLALPLSLNVPVEASKNDGSIFTYTPSSSGKNSNTNWGRDDYSGYYYYNWYAATAEQNNNAGNVDVDGSICPKGWKLPSNYTVSGNNPATGTPWKDMSWAALTEKYLGITTTTDTSYGYQVLGALPISLSIYGGYRDNGSWDTPGHHTNCWTSTSYDGSTAYHLGVDTARIYPQNNISGGKSYFGFSVRCLAVR